eukprot:6197843-Pleurochrysis_carterae.AAC.5
MAMAAAIAARRLGSIRAFPCASTKSAIADGSAPCCLPPRALCPWMCGSAYRIGFIFAMGSAGYK